MAHRVHLPPFGEVMEEGTVVVWHKKEGDQVVKGEPLFDLETDKSVLTVESFHRGVLLKIVVPENQTVPVGTTIAWIGEPGEEVPAE